jgi:hypothetical protein
LSTRYSLGVDFSTQVAAIVFRGRTTKVTGKLSFQIAGRFAQMLFTALKSHSLPLCKSKPSGDGSCLPSVGSFSERAVCHASCIHDHRTTSVIRRRAWSHGSSPRGGEEPCWHQSLRSFVERITKSCAKSWPVAMSCLPLVGENRMLPRR